MLLALAASFPAAAGNSTKSISDMYGLFVEEIVGTTRLVCSKRFPETEAAWTKAFQAWQTRNAAALKQLQADALTLRRRLREEAFDPASTKNLDDRVGEASLVDQFALLAASGPLQTLGVLNDAEAKTPCGTSLAEAEPGGEMDRFVKQAREGAAALLGEGRPGPSRP